uniref:5-hydroxytryptamine (serotonin) receptor 3A n=1 Tax=Salarias fasciatus TaxID=181472 RepID=A0A672I0A1_SALFA
SSSMMLNCSEPDTPSLLEALRPVFNLSAIRPVVYFSTGTIVTLDFTLFGILGVVSDTKWKNEFLSWDSESCGTERITVPRKLLWVPDVVINEFMEKNTAPFVPYTYLFHDGWVIDKQPVRVVSSCRIDTYAFPFDIQNCTFKPEKGVGLTILSISNITLLQVGVRRRATLYVVNLLIPTCFLITVDLFSFILPPKSVDRSLFKMTLILGYTVFLLSMNNMLPVSGNTIPLINVFLTLCLSLMVASLLETIIITNLICGSARYPAVPRWIRVIFLHILGRLVYLFVQLCPLRAENIFARQHNMSALSSLLSSALEIKLSSTATQESETKEQESSLSGDKAVQELRSVNMDLQAIRQQLEKELRGNQNAEDWIQVGFVIDRLMFILYILFISISFVTIIILWGKSYSTTHDH